MNTLPPILTIPLPFSNFVQPLLLFLLSCLFGWIGDRASFDLLFYLMILWISHKRRDIPTDGVPFPNHPMTFSKILPQQNWCCAHGASPHLKMKPTPNWKTTLSPPLKSEPPSRKWFQEQNPEKSETVINTCVFNCETAL